MTLYTKEKIKLMSLFIFTACIFVISMGIIIHTFLEINKNIKNVNQKQDKIIIQIKKSNFSTND
jgi:hypothetical protein